MIVSDYILAESDCFMNNELLFKSSACGPWRFVCNRDSVCFARTENTKFKQNVNIHLKLFLKLSFLIKHVLRWVNERFFI